MKRNITGGIILILIAMLIIGSGMGIVPYIPWFKILCSIGFTYVAIKGLLRREFFSAIGALCCLGWIFDDYLGIESITPFPLFIAGFLLALGLSMIFKKDMLHRKFYKDGAEWSVNFGDEGAIGHEEWSQDGRHVSLENNFNSVSKYVNAAAFSSAHLESNFGSANIYFNNAVMAGPEATVSLENNFGQMNVFFPKNWRLSISQDTAFGRINIFGEPNRDMDAPLVIINAESNFGELNIYFE